ncbi:hypothetical protein ASF39_20115 [Methylobacterium sp. Leaf108]|nr:hypothetical protein ASF39_20115 [Methylobacterium sp. Leaf108]
MRRAPAGLVAAPASEATLPAASRIVALPRVSPVIARSALTASTTTVWVKTRCEASEAAAS